MTVDPLANDTDGAGRNFVRSSLRLVDPVTGARVLSVTVAGQGIWRVDVQAGTITFTPAPGFTGSPTPSRYWVGDNFGGSSMALIEINYGSAQGSGLPRTGADIGSMSLAGFGLLLAGVFVLATTRRRRHW